jgi:hypothetical protein
MTTDVLVYTFKRFIYQFLSYVCVCMELVVLLYDTMWEAVGLHK